MSDERISIHGQWSGSLTFFLAATGAAVGLGNIWRFPYVVGEHGGGAYVLFYVLFIVLIGIPILMAETLIGRRGRQSPYHSLYILASEEQRTRRWAWVGGLSAIAGFLILSYYSVVAGQVMAYTVRAASSAFDSQSADGIRSLYNTFVAQPESVLAWHTIFMVVICIVVARGVAHGLEKTIKLMMPGLVILLCLLVVHAIYNGSFVEGASYLIDMDFKKLFYERDGSGLYVTNAHGELVFTMKGVLSAMGHAFFTLSLGVGVIMMYGSYLDRNASITKIAFSVAAADTVIALLAGLAIFPIVFSYGLQAGQGPGLVFKTLPIAFGSMPFGTAIGTAFFALLLLAALTSAIALIEPSVTWLIEKRGMNRVQATVWSGAACWLVGIISVFAASGTTLRNLIYSFANAFELSDLDLSHRLFDLTGFQIIDNIVTLILLPMIGILIALFAGWIMSSENTRYELNIRQPWLYQSWLVLIRYVTPVLMLVVCIAGLVQWIRKYLLYNPVL